MHPRDHGSASTCFNLKSAFFATLRLNFSRTEISTAKPMAVGCVQHYSTYFINKLGKSLEPFYPKNCQKGPKRAKKGDFSKISNCYKNKWMHFHGPSGAYHICKQIVTPSKESYCNVD